MQLWMDNFRGSIGNMKNEIFTFSKLIILQRDMLQARLSLVNQHLLYERSCRYGRGEIL